MLKITDPKYFLPIIEAMEAGKIMSTGRTRPMIVRGVCQQNGHKGEYVVKLKGSNEMWQGSSLNEILGAFIALELDFQVPEPVIVNISNDLVATMLHRHDNFKIASESLGYNFGTALQEAYQEMIPGQPITKELRVKLLDLFALDVLIGNTDRRIDKPNFLTNGKDLLIYDHELAFSFTQLLPFARNTSPWLIPSDDMKWLSRNFCFQQLKGNSYDFSNFIARLPVLNEEFWEKAEQVIPEEWENEHFDIIKGYITTIVEHRNQFAIELNRVLL